MDDKLTPAGGIVAEDLPIGKPDVPSEVPAQNPPSPPPEEGTPATGPTALPVSAEPPAPPPETFVVPPVAPGPPKTGPAPAENPFIPQGVVPEGQVNPPPVKPPSGGSTLPRRLLMLVVFFLLAGALFFGGRFILSMVSGPAQATISYWGLWEDNPVVQSILSDFQKQNPKITVQYVKQSPRQYRERLQAAIARGEGPDVFRFHNTWVAMLRNELAIAPKDVMTATEFSNTFYPIATSNLVAGQSIFGMPMEIDGLGLYYNEDLFAAAGATKPTTWEDVLNLVPKLTVKTDSTITTSAIALGTTGNVENFSDILATMMLQNGASLVAPTGKEAEETLIFYRKFANPTDPVYTWNDTLDNSIYAFATGKVAMILAPSWRAFDIKQINPNLHFKITPIPQLPGNTVTWASYWVEGVSAKTKYPAQAWKLVKYLTSREVVTRLYTEEAKARLFGEPYARVDLANSLSQDPYAGAFVQQAANAKSFPLASRTFDNGLNDKLIKYLTDAVNGLSQGSAPTAVLQTMSAGFQQVLGQYGLVSANPPAQR